MKKNKKSKRKGFVNASDWLSEKFGEEGTKSRIKLDLFGFDNQLVI